MRTFIHFQFSNQAIIQSGKFQDRQAPMLLNLPAGEKPSQINRLSHIWLAMVPKWYEIDHLA